MLTRIVLLLGFCCALTACDPEPAQPVTDTGPDPSPLMSDRVNFLEPVVGQFNTFQRMSYECGGEIPSEASELTLTVTDVTDEAITFTEEQATGDAPYVFTAQRRPGHLVISAEDRQRSSLLYFYGSDSIRLAAAPSTTLEYRDCVFFHGDTRFTGDLVALVPSFDLAGESYDNLKTVSCVPTILDIDGYLLYNEHSLLGSITTSSSEFGGVVTTITTVYLLKDAYPE